MYAEFNERTGLYNVMELTKPDMGVIELGLSSVHMNTHEHFLSQKLMREIDAELTDGQSPNKLLTP